MLWVLKSTVLMRGFFCEPKTDAKIMAKKTYNFTLKICVYLNLRSLQQQLQHVLSLISTVCPKQDCPTRYRIPS